MLKSCSYCGRLHKIGVSCKQKPRYDGPRTQKTDLFRKTSAWTCMREKILARDGYRCRLCEMEQEERRYNPGRLSVHHIEPLAQRWDLRLDEDNLLTLCDGHHAQAERGAYQRELLHELAKAPPGGTPSLVRRFARPYSSHT